MSFLQSKPNLNVWLRGAGTTGAAGAAAPPALQVGVQQGGRHVPFSYEEKFNSETGNDCTSTCHIVYFLISQLLMSENSHSRITVFMSLCRQDSSTQPGSHWAAQGTNMPSSDGRVGWDTLIV